MDKLSDKILLNLFKYLNIQELIGYKIICKKWYNLISKLKFEELIVKEISYLNTPNYWFYSFKAINLNNALLNAKLTTFNNSSFLDHFINLKYLKINNISIDNLIVLNNFNQLIQLDIDNHNLCLDNDMKLNLLNLKILKVMAIGDQLNKLILNTPSLEILSCFKVQFIELIKPESLIYLEIKKIDQTGLEQFTNLKKLKCFDHFDIQYLNQLSNTVQKLYLIADNQLRSHLIKGSVWTLMKDKSKYNKNDLEIYLNGLLIKSNKSIDSYGFGNDDILNIIYRNYYDHSKIEITSFDVNLEDKLGYYVQSIDYQQLLRIFRQELDFNLISKFNNIQILDNFSEIKNTEQFIKFIDYCPNLKHLSLIRPLLKAEFYEQLPAKCPLLMFFYFYETDELNLDYRFLLNFKLLKRFETYHQIKVYKVENLLIKLKFIEYFKFKIKKNIIWIQKIRETNLYNLNNNKDYYSNLEFNQLIDKCKEI